MRLMAAGDDPALTAMAEASGTDLTGYKAQRASTEIRHDPADAVAFTQGADLPATLLTVAEVLVDKGTLGEAAPSADFVGVACVDGSVTGDESNVTFRFDTAFMPISADVGR